MTSSRYLFRQATVADSEELSTLVNSAYRGESSKRGWTTEADYLGGQRTNASLLAREIQTPNHEIHCMVDTELGRIVACVFLQNQSAETTYLGMLTVSPELQAAGLGRQILAHSESLATARGSRRMIMRVIHIRQSLIEWYERRGYRLNGETQPFPYGNSEFGEPNRPDLHFVVLEKSLIQGK